MPPKNRNNRNSHPRPTAHHHVPSDYDTDTAYATDAMSLPQPAPIPARTNEELNLSVLQRHDPSVHQILSVAPFAVVYTFNPVSTSWEKQGAEGTLFVCSLLPPVGGPQIERYSCIVLNRRGLENFSSELFSAESVQVTDDYVILQVEGEDGSANIYGLWIFAEEGGSTVQTRVVNALIIQECAKRAEDSRDAAAVADVEEEYIEEELPPSMQRDIEEPPPPTIHQQQKEPEQQRYEYEQEPQGQQVNLLHLFKSNQQRQRPALASPFQSHDQQQYYAMQQQQQLQHQQHQQQLQQQQHQQQLAAMQQQQQLQQQQMLQQHQAMQHQHQQHQHQPQNFNAAPPPPPGYGAPQQYSQQYPQQHPQQHPPPQAQPQGQADVLMSLFSNARRGY
ncbi:PH domain-like protein [Aureobasidium pullulans]|nr:PH domain-like protein [Aureobasidium pullulans]